MNKKRSDAQEIIWAMMLELLPIFEENHYQYFIVGGTLIGAIRHKGFIPWDDDMDLAMYRKEYDRFLEEIPDKLPPHLKLHTYWNEPSHKYYFARIVDTRHTISRKGSQKERLENVWIDIFPLDSIPDDPIHRYFNMFRFMFTRLRYHMSTFDRVNLNREGRSAGEKFFIWLIKTTGIGMKSDPGKWLDRIDRQAKRYSGKNTKWLMDYMGHYTLKEMFPRSWYGDGAMYEFEGKMLRGPYDADKLLTHFFGDYMTPRKSTHAAEFVE